MFEYIVILNRIEARIFERRSLSSELKLVKVFFNPLGKARNREMQTDRPGLNLFRAKTAKVPYSMTREKNPHEDITIQFIKKVARYLGSERRKHVFDKVIVIADPHLTGLLTMTVDKTTQKLMTAIQKNLGKLSDHQIKRYLKSHEALTK